MLNELTIPAELLDVLDTRPSISLLCRLRSGDLFPRSGSPGMRRETDGEATIASTAKELY